MPPEQAAPFLEAIPIHKFYGVGKVTAAKLKDVGILTGADLKRLSEEHLRTLFGERGTLLYAYVRGKDHRPVQPTRVRKSVGKEVTLAQDIDDPHEMLSILEQLAEQVARRLAELGLTGKTITLKVRWSDFRLITRSLTVPAGVQDAPAMMIHLRSLLAQLGLKQQPVRLLGVTLSNLMPLSEKEYRQVVTWASLWDRENESQDDAAVERPSL